VIAIHNPFAGAQLSPNVVLIEELCQSKKECDTAAQEAAPFFTIREKRQYAVPRGDNILRL
jgi:hypothetical protein